MNKIRTAVKLSAAICIAIPIFLMRLVSPLHAEAQPPSLFRSVPWPEIESLLSTRPFVSQEELLQLFHILYSRQEKSIRLDKPLMQKLAQTMKSLFPLEACESITMHDNRVHMTFNEPQDIFVPNTWLLASLKISKHLVLRIEEMPQTSPSNSRVNPDDNDTHSVRLIIEEGRLQLDLSFLLRIFGRKLRDGEGSELIYQINEKKQVSNLSLIEVTPLAEDDLFAEKQPPDKKADDYTWIDIRHSDFPDTKDIGIAANKMRILDSEIELLPEGKVRLGDNEPRQDSRAYHKFRTSLEWFKDFIYSKSKPISIDYTRTFGYKFEERKMSLTVGFRWGKDKKSIL